MFVLALYTTGRVWKISFSQLFSQLDIRCKFIRYQKFCEVLKQLRGPRKNLRKKSFGGAGKELGQGINYAQKNGTSCLYAHNF